ncbi:MAG: hypothetical protein QXQ39_04920 [Conexivisphaerales archaeon]
MQDNGRKSGKSIRQRAATIINISRYGKGIILLGFDFQNFSFSLTFRTV